MTVIGLVGGERIRYSNPVTHQRLLLTQTPRIFGCSFGPPRSTITGNSPAAKQSMGNQRICHRRKLAGHQQPLISYAFICTSSRPT